MTITASVTEQYHSSKNTSILFFDISHQSTTYKEIVNKKSFDGNTLLSQVGGFIGIFLGFSLLQVPDIIFSFLKGIQTSIKKLQRSQNETRNSLNRNDEASNDTTTPAVIKSTNASSAPYV